MGDQRHQRGRGGHPPNQRYNPYDHNQSGQYGRPQSPSRYEFRGHSSYGDGGYERSGRYDRPVSPARYVPDYRHDRMSGHYYPRNEAGRQRELRDRERNVYGPPRLEEQFTFRAPGPHFPYEQPPPPPPPDEVPPPPPPTSPPPPQWTRPPPREHPAQPRRKLNDRHNRGRGGFTAQRGDRMNGGFGRGRPWRAPAAHQRNILHNTQRGGTPEQLAGMNANGGTRFTQIDSSADEREVISLTEDADDDEADEVPRKRAKWTNPEFLTALPPSENNAGPRKDIVQVIRKSKIETHPNLEGPSDEAKKNNDFISFNMDEDNATDEDASVGNRAETSSASDMEGFTYKPALPPIPSTQNMPALPAKMPSGYRFEANTNGTQASSSRVFPDGVGLPPKPPTSLLMPTDEELAAKYANVRPITGKKRKRKEQATAVGGILQEWKPNPLAGDAAPWYNNSSYAPTATGQERLLIEIRQFYAFVRPRDYEETVRQNLIERIQAAVAKSKKTNVQFAEIRCFGSYAAGLYLPTADMDLVAVSSTFLGTRKKIVGQGQRGIRDFGHHLINIGVTTKDRTTFIVKAKVPIVKFVDKTTGLNVDISFENDSGLHANATVAVWTDEYPAMPILVIIVKQMLAMRGLNEVHTGGLGGFSIICMVVNLLAQIPDIQPGSMRQTERYGEFLMRFLDFYGNILDVTATGLVMNPPGYFDKAIHPGKYSENNQRLTIIDPNRPENDISGGTGNIRAILECFRSAHSSIQRELQRLEEGHDLDASILECVLGGDYSSFTTQRNALYALHLRGDIYSRVPQKLPNSRPLNIFQAMNHPAYAVPEGIQAKASQAMNQQPSNALQAMNQPPPNSSQTVNQPSVNPFPRTHHRPNKRGGYQGPRGKQHEPAKPAPQNAAKTRKERRKEKRDMKDLNQH